MPNGILGPRDYFSDRTLGDTTVQAMQIKAARGQIEESEARREAYGKAYGGDPSKGYETEATQEMRSNEIKTVGSMFGLVDDIAKSHGEEAAQELSKRMWNENEVLQKYFPGKAPEVVGRKGKTLYMNMAAQKDTQDVKGNKIPAGSTVKIEVIDGEPGRVLGMVAQPQAEQREISESQAIDKYKSIQKDLHILRSNPMSFAGDPEEYERSLLQQAEYVKQFLPSNYGPEKPPGQLAGGSIVRTGVDQSTGKKVIQYDDGTIQYAP